METENIPDTSALAPILSLVDGVLSLSELCNQLQVEPRRMPVDEVDRLVDRLLMLIPEGATPTT